MDYQAFIDGFLESAVLVSVTTTDDGGYSDIRLVAANQAYIDSIEHPAEGLELYLNHFVPNERYNAYMERDINFEQACYHAAVDKIGGHAYVKSDRFPVWLDLGFLPTSFRDGNTYYCVYLMRIDQTANYAKMANVSGDVAAQVLDTTIQLQGTNDFEKTMNDVVSSIRRLCEAEMCTILLVDDETKECRLLGEDRLETTTLYSMAKYIPEGFYEIASSWKDTLCGSNCIITTNQHDMEYIKERNPIWYESLIGAGVKTLVLFPLKANNQIIGYMWASNFAPERESFIKNALELTTFILSSEINNYLMLDRLRTLSSRDMLTGVFNRNEMNMIVDALASGKDQDTDSVGIIFADLNGLKRINDSCGHAAGDQLLKRAACALGDVFSDAQIFRAGGDEFCVIIKNTCEADIESQIKRLREVATNYDEVCFAIGGAVVRPSTDIRLALREADVRMYQDKRAYYDAHPERQHRTSKDKFHMET